LKISTNVKIAMQCFENFRGANPPPLVARLHTAKYAEDEPSYKNCHVDIYFKTKTVVTHAAKC